MTYIVAVVVFIAIGIIGFGIWNDSARWIERALEDMSPDQEKDKSDS